MDRALYGEGGFYRRGEPAERHFRTSVAVSVAFAAAVARLLDRVDEALGRPAQVDLVDVGASRGQLLAGVAAVLPERLRGRLRLTAVELAPAPPGLGQAIDWVREPPQDIVGLVIANEWLDNVPADVVEQGPDGPRIVLVDPETGVERAGNRPEPYDEVWLARWWPLDEPGERAEVGWPRDQAWAKLLGRITRGVAVAIDYGHLRHCRPRYGTLAGYRDGRMVPPVPDGSCDLTAHVAMDACMAAARRGEPALVTQREALKALGVTGRRPALELARSDPRRYVTQLQNAGEEAELLEPQGLGGFWWLVQAIGVPLPARLRGSMTT
jgi:SAM-dependent MidA family methyltransferase